MQHETKFEITPATREAVQKWIKQSGLRSEDFLFPSRVHASPHLATPGHTWARGSRKQVFKRRQRRSTGHVSMFPVIAFGNRQLLFMKQGRSAGN
jgi:hypothetical protein